MKENFFVSMVSEGGKISHKRVIAVLFASAGIFTILYAVTHYKEMILHIFNYTLAFILLMSGVATLSQLICIIKNTPAPKEEEKIEEKKVGE